MQQLSRFAVDTLDRGFECRDGFVQIERLRIEERLALGRLFELGKCCQIDGTEFGDRRVEAVDFCLIRRRATFLLNRLGEFFEIGAGFGQLRRIVFFVDARFLLLHAQLGNLVAQGLQAFLDHTFALFERLQFTGRRFHRIARIRQRFFHPGLGA